jgi:SP family general alpha glucoside:H+ symporter-like MFS transporter
MGIHSTPSTAEAWAAGTFVILLSATANFSIGPVVYTIVSEIPSTRLRAKSIILARNAYNAINIAFVNVVTYRQLSPDEWNWGPKSGFFWAGINAIFTAWVFFRLRKSSPFPPPLLSLLSLFHSGPVHSLAHPFFLPLLYAAAS